MTLQHDMAYNQLYPLLDMLCQKLVYQASSSLTLQKCLADVKSGALRLHQYLVLNPEPEVFLLSQNETVGSDWSASHAY